MFCNKCGEILRDGALRCPVCGAFQKKKGTKVNTHCDCDTNKRVTFETKHTRTHSTYSSGCWEESTCQSGQSKPATYRDARIPKEEILRLVKDFFTGYNNFSGRTSLRDFWMTCLLLLIATVFLVGFTGPLIFLWSMALMFPKIAMCVRRLRDTGRSGTLMLLALIPIAGPIILLIFLCQPTVPYSWDDAK